MKCITALADLTEVWSFAHACSAGNLPCCSEPLCRDLESTSASRTAAEPGSATRWWETDGTSLPVPQPELGVAKTRHPMVAPAPLHFTVLSDLNSQQQLLWQLSCHKNSRERIFAGREPVLCSCSQQGGCRTALFPEQNRHTSIMFALLGFGLLA